MHSKLLSIFAGLSVLSLAQARPGSALASRDTPNSLWCGYVKNAAVKQVSAVWTVPDVSLPSPNSHGDYEIFQWVGIDGASPSSCGNVLLQGGTSQVFNNGRYVTDFWYEFYNPNQTPSLHVAYPPLKIGDQVRVTVTATSANDGNIFFENLTTGVSDTQYVHSDMPLCFEHVEWVAEAPTQRLPNFATFDFTQVSAVTGDGTSINAAGSELWYLNGAAAKCSASMGNGGSSIRVFQQ
ncbi:aspergillopepsin-2 precursor [Cordyceps javanica]|uniref:Aspergillopepsin-2 n=1 Tax=Cordyceps javanica TaxID=43265 RepID=A0A545V079_9HYPO|nr:aspergillopepsin-2 precursor [Cordyceps javanica]TQW05671.1 aspergillopepsin-2 precursor [Cordyceps javanica]